MGTAQVLSIPYWDFLVLNHASSVDLPLSISVTFNSLLGFSSFESIRGWGHNVSLLLLSIPYWDFLVLNLRFRVLVYFLTVTFNSLLGFSSFESKWTGILRMASIRLSIPYWDFLVLNLVQAAKHQPGGGTLSIPYWDFLVLNRFCIFCRWFLLFCLSIPYWDFLVLNLPVLMNFSHHHSSSFNSLLGFSSFESNETRIVLDVQDLTFNSLLGFSSFESLPNISKALLKLSSAFNSLLGFSSFESLMRHGTTHWNQLTFNSLLGFSSFESRRGCLSDRREDNQLSIPYWDFLVLNRFGGWLDRSEGFSSFESS